MNRIQELRLADGKYSCRGFASFIYKTYGCKFSFAVLSLWENNRNPNPKWEAVEAMADYFDVTTDYLMGLTDYCPSPKELFDDKVQKELRHTNLETLRKAKGLDSLHDLEHYMKASYGDEAMSIAFLSQLERNHTRGRNFNDIALLAKAFGVTCDYLMGRTRHSLTGSSSSYILPEARLLLKQFDERCQEILGERLLIFQGA